jgi:hypothetical protein
MPAREQILQLKQRMAESIIGQEQVIERLLLTLLANGNLLLEGLPGLAKTRAVKSLARHLESEFRRIQFTPDLLPSDVTGTEVENLPSLISTREFHVQETWQPQPQKVHVGDGFTRTVTLTAPDVPGMVFPPLPLAKVDGLAVYPKPPVVQDQIERGDFIGKRIDTVTYICERPGQFTLPALVIPWWDLQNQKLMQATLPAVTLEVEPGHTSNANAAAPTGEAQGRQWPWWTVGAVLLAAAAAATWRKRDAVLAVWEHRQAQRQASEAGRFARLLDSCRVGDAKAAYNALLRWLESTHHGPDSPTIEDFLVRRADVDLRRQVDALQEAILGRATDWDGEALADALRRARRHVQRGTTADTARLPALNPVWPPTPPPT